MIAQKVIFFLDTTIFSEHVDDICKIIKYDVYF